jgi:hypothetical protein
VPDLFPSPSDKTSAQLVKESTVTSQTVSPSHRRASKFAGSAVVASCAIPFLGARFVWDEDLQLPLWEKLTAALIFMLPTVLFRWVVTSALRRLDELHRLVHLDALAIVHPLAILLLVTLGVLQLAIDLATEDWSYRHIWPLSLCFHLIGLAVARAWPSAFRCPGRPSMPSRARSTSPASPLRFELLICSASRSKTALNRPQTTTMHGA